MVSSQEKLERKRGLKIQITEAVFAWTGGCRAWG